MTEPFVQVEASSTFNRNLRALAKKYRNIRNDIQLVVDQLERGEYPGDRIPEIKYEVFNNSPDSFSRERNRDSRQKATSLCTVQMYSRTPKR